MKDANSQTRSLKNQGNPLKKRSDAHKAAQHLHEHQTSKHLSKYRQQLNENHSLQEIVEYIDQELVDGADSYEIKLVMDLESKKIKDF